MAKRGTTSRLRVLKSWLVRKMQKRRFVRPWMLLSELRKDKPLTRLYGTLDLWEMLEREGKQPRREGKRLRRERKHTKPTHTAVFAYR